MSDTPRFNSYWNSYRSGAISVEEFKEAVQNMERENTALREDKEKYAGLLARWLRMADDCHSECREVGYSEYNITAGLLCDTRAAIDATRKEAKP